MKMTNEQIQNFSKQIEEAGLKSDSNTNEFVKGLHHFVVHTVIEDGKYDETFAGFPKAFENCFEDTTEDGHDLVVDMFYLEDCTVEEAEEIVSWLKNNKNWTSYSRE